MAASPVGAGAASGADAVRVAVQRTVQRTVRVALWVTTCISSHWRISFHLFPPARVSQNRNTPLWTTRRCAIYPSVVTTNQFAANHHSTLHTRTQLSKQVKIPHTHSDFAPPVRDASSFPALHCTLRRSILTAQKEQSLNGNFENFYFDFYKMATLLPLTPYSDTVKRGGEI